MLFVNSNEKNQIISELPENIKLSYENIVHNKVLNPDFISIIPQGKKCLVWFTLKKDKQICYLLFMEPKGKHLKLPKTISNICVIENLSFDFSLSYSTILYGTLFHYKTQPFFTVEDILFNQGINLIKEGWINKLNLIKRIFNKKIYQSSNSLFKYGNSLYFGLPILVTKFEHVRKQIESLPYKLYCVLYIKNEKVYKMNIQNINFDLDINLDSNLEKEDLKIDLKLKSEFFYTPSNQIKEPIKNYFDNKQKPIKKEIIFNIRPDIQNDIYHLFCLDDKDNEYYVDVAYIPDYKTSVYMNSLFRKIKENDNLDYLEESDDEEEFENGKEDRFVNLDKELLMYCKYHYKFKKWVPQKKVINNNSLKPIYYNDVISFFSENRKAKLK
jgi:hypothetical protein